MKRNPYVQVSLTALAILLSVSCGAPALDDGGQSETKLRMSHDRDASQSEYSKLLDVVEACLENDSKKSCKELKVSDLIPMQLQKNRDLDSAFDASKLMVKCDSGSGKCRFSIPRKSHSSGTLKIDTAKVEPAKRLIFKGSKLSAKIRLIERGRKKTLEICSIDKVYANKREGSFLERRFDAKVLGMKITFNKDKLSTSRLYVDAMDGESTYPSKKCDF